MKVLMCALFLAVMGLIGQLNAQPTPTPRLTTIDDFDKLFQRGLELAPEVADALHRIMKGKEELEKEGKRLDAKYQEFEQTLAKASAENEELIASNELLRKVKAEYTRWIGMVTFALVATFAFCGLHFYYAFTRFLPNWKVCGALRRLHQRDLGLQLQDSSRQNEANQHFGLFMGYLEMAQYHLNRLVAETRAPRFVFASLLTGTVALLKSAKMFGVNPIEPHQSEYSQISIRMKAADAALDAREKSLAEAERNLKQKVREEAGELLKVRHAHFLAQEQQLKTSLANSQRIEAELESRCRIVAAYEKGLRDESLKQNDLSRDLNDLAHAIEQDLIKAQRLKAEAEEKLQEADNKLASALSL